MSKRELPDFMKKMKTDPLPSPSPSDEGFTGAAREEKTSLDDFGSDAVSTDSQSSSAFDRVVGEEHTKTPSLRVPTPRAQSPEEVDLPPIDFEAILAPQEKSTDNKDAVEQEDPVEVNESKDEAPVLISEEPDDDLARKIKSFYADKDKVEKKSKKPKKPKKTREPKRAKEIAEDGPKEPSRKPVTLKPVAAVVLLALGAGGGFLASNTLKDAKATDEDHDKAAPVVGEVLQEGIPATINAEGATIAGITPLASYDSECYSLVDDEVISNVTFFEATLSVGDLTKVTTSPELWVSSVKDSQNKEILVNCDSSSYGPVGQGESGKLTIVVPNEHKEVHLTVTDGSRTWQAAWELPKGQATVDDLTTTEDDGTTLTRTEEEEEEKAEEVSHTTTADQDNKSLTEDITFTRIGEEPRVTKVENNPLEEILAN